MKKQYEKPIAELVVFEMNTAIASCDIKLYINVNSGSDCEKDPTLDGIEYDDKYCYYTSQPEYTIFNS